MTTLKHTPGPWTVNAWPQRHDEIRIGAVGTPLICAIMVRDVSINEQKANARLIAAAPELLEALILARRYMLKDYPEEAGPYILPMYMEQDLRRIDAAIAKAKGGAV